MSRSIPTASTRLRSSRAANSPSSRQPGFGRPGAHQPQKPPTDAGSCPRTLDCASAPASTIVGSHLGVRISNFAPKKPSNGIFLTLCDVSSCKRSRKSHCCAKRWRPAPSTPRGRPARSMLEAMRSLIRSPPISRRAPYHHTTWICSIDARRRDARSILPAPSICAEKESARDALLARLIRFPAD